MIYMEVPSSTPGTKLGTAEKKGSSSSSALKYGPSLALARALPGAS